MIALDANGADAGPAVVAQGARQAGLPVTLYGPAAVLSELELPPGSRLIDCPDGIANHEEPVRAVRSRPDASIVRAARAVGDGEVEGLVSAGSTGAALAASVLHIGRIKGVHRPAVAVLIPVPGRPTLLLDAGASVQARPEHLVQFAYMGSAFMEAVHGVSRPRVGLLSVGEEEGKGTEQVVEAGARLRDGPLNYAGNVEGGDLTGGDIDVIVTDGFTGNVAIKAIEGTARTVLGAVRDTIRSGTVSSIGGLLIRGKAAGLRRELDQDAVGGALLLGLKGVVVIAHGGSSPRGIAGALDLADRAVGERMVERTAAALQAGGAMRSGAGASFASAHD